MNAELIILFLFEAQVLILSFWFKETKSYQSKYKQLFSYLFFIKKKVFGSFTTSLYNKKKYTFPHLSALPSTHKLEAG